MKKNTGARTQSGSKIHIYICSIMTKSKLIITKVRQNKESCYSYRQLPVLLTVTEPCPEIKFTSNIPQPDFIANIPKPKPIIFSQIISQSTIYLSLTCTFSSISHSHPCTSITQTRPSTPTTKRKKPHFLPATTFYTLVISPNLPDYPSPQPITMLILNVAHCRSHPQTSVMAYKRLKIMQHAHKRIFWSVICDGVAPHNSLCTTIWIPSWLHKQKVTVKSIHVGQLVNNKLSIISVRLLLLDYTPISSTRWRLVYRPGLERSQYCSYPTRLEPCKSTCTSFCCSATCTNFLQVTHLYRYLPRRKLDNKFCW